MGGDSEGAACSAAARLLNARCLPSGPQYSAASDRVEELLRSEASKVYGSEGGSLEDLVRDNDLLFIRPGQRARGGRRPRASGRRPAGTDPGGERGGLDPQHCQPTAQAIPGARGRRLPRRPLLYRELLPARCVPPEGRTGAAGSEATAAARRQTDEARGRARCAGARSG